MRRRIRVRRPATDPRAARNPSHRSADLHSCSVDSNGCPSFGRDCRYSGYACDVSMLAVDCKVESDSNCLTEDDEAQDDWFHRFFNVTNEMVEADDDTAGIASMNEECSEWPMMCCGDSDCAEYSDSTCSDASMMCDSFSKFTWHVSSKPCGRMTVFVVVFFSQ